jgi:hypothetical protein
MGEIVEKEAHLGITMDRQAAFQFAREILQHVYRLGEAGKYSVCHKFFPHGGS